MIICQINRPPIMQLEIPEDLSELSVKLAPSYRFCKADFNRIEGYNVKSAGYVKFTSFTFKRKNEFYHEMCDREYPAHTKEASLLRI